MNEYTIFWQHPQHGRGMYYTNAVDIETAIDIAYEEIAWDLYEFGEDEEPDDLEIEYLMDDIDITAVEGYITEPSEIYYAN